MADLQQTSHLPVGSELEAALLALMCKGRTVEAIKSLRDSTGWGLPDALRWVNAHLAEAPARMAKPCPYCDKPLATDRAQQCFSCGHDWHDPKNVVQRGDPEWNRFGLNKAATYVVELCQKPTRERYTKYREASSSHDPCCVLETEPASGEQFIAWGHHQYARHLKLANGGRFGFEAHGIWLTHEEMDYILQGFRGSTEGETPPWVNGLAPLLPPK